MVYPIDRHVCTHTVTHAMYVLVCTTLCLPGMPSCEGSHIYKGADHYEAVWQCLQYEFLFGRLDLAVNELSASIP